MKTALKQAALALHEGEWPVGAVVVRRGRIIATGRNMVEQLLDPTAHAELIACRRAMKKLNKKYLDDCWLFVTLEPCKMCKYTLATMRIGMIFYGARAEKNIKPPHFIDGVCAGACGRLLEDFGKVLR